MVIVRLYLRRTLLASRREFSSAGRRDYPVWAEYLGVRSKEDWAKATSRPAQIFYVACAGSLVGIIALSNMYGIDVNPMTRSGQKIPVRRRDESMSDFLERLKSSAGDR